MSQNGRGRPPLDVEIVRIQITLSLRRGRDDDLIAFFATLPRGAKPTAVMAAMRSGNLAAAADEDYVSDDEMDDALTNLML
jgi:hypothetical protein